MLLAIVVFQILMIGVFGLKENPAVSALSLPPLFFTVAFKIVIMMYFERVAEPMEMDDHEKEGKPAEEEKVKEEADEEFLLAAHNCFIATSTVPGLFLLSTDDPSENNGANGDKADIQGSSSAKDPETTKLVEADNSLETTPM